MKLSIKHLLAFVMLLSAAGATCALAQNSTMPDKGKLSISTQMFLDELQGDLNFDEPSPNRLGIPGQPRLLKAIERPYVTPDTIDGKVAYDVKAGTQTDTRGRLKGKGVPTLRNKDIRGDHYVTLVVQTPEKLSHEAKELLRKFDELTGDSLNAASRASQEKEGTSTKKKRLRK